MTWNQVYKILKIALVAILVMFVFEIIFELPIVSDTLSSYITSIDNLIWIWIALWIIMFVQVCFIPIPAYIVINAAIQVGILNKSLGLGLILDSTFWLFVIITLSAYMLGAIIAYLMGYKWGRKAVEWSAGSSEEYDKWATTLNLKGKYWYAASIVLPIFPDDLLCIVAGSVKFNFKLFVLFNLIGRFIGLVFMIVSLTLFSSINNTGFPWTTLIWGIALLITSILTVYVKKYKINTV